MLMSLTAVVANDADDTVASANNENLTVQTSTDDGAVIEQSNQEIMGTEQGSESDQGDVLSASSDEDVLGVTFSQLHQDINNQIYSGYVYLDKDYTSTYSYSSYSIYQDVVIDGQGHTIDCGGYNRVFQISRSGYLSPINLTFKNINFINAYKTDYDIDLIDNYAMKKYDTIVLARHIGPDPDALGSTLGLKEIIKS